MDAKKTPVPTERAKNQYNNVLANFRRLGTSFHAYCKQSGLHRGNVTKALLGTWKSEKAKALRINIIKASKGKA